MGIDFVYFYDFLLEFGTVRQSDIFFSFSFITKLRPENYPSNTVKAQVGRARCDWFFVNCLFDGVKSELYACNIFA